MPLSTAPTTELDTAIDTDALDLLRRLTGHPASELRADQLDVIRRLVGGRERVLLVQRTGWGKSAVYFIATRVRRDRGAGPTLLVSPLLALMRNQVDAAARMGVRATTLNSANRDDWDDIRTRLDGDEVDILLIYPERHGQRPGCRRRARGRGSGRAHGRTMAPHPRPVVVRPRAGGVAHPAPA